MVSQYEDEKKKNVKECHYGDGEVKMRKRKIQKSIIMLMKS